MQDFVTFGEEGVNFEKWNLSSSCLQQQQPDILQQAEQSSAKLQGVAIPPTVSFQAFASNSNFAEGA